MTTKIQCLNDIMNKILWSTDQGPPPARLVASAGANGVFQEVHSGKLSGPTKAHEFTSVSSEATHMEGLVKAGVTFYHQGKLFKTQEVCFPLGEEAYVKAMPSMGGAASMPVDIPIFEYAAYQAKKVRLVQRIRARESGSQVFVQSGPALAPLPPWPYLPFSKFSDF